MEKLIIENVTIRHKATGRVLLRNVSTELSGGVCLGIVGESGSGKTLLCRAIMGLLPPTLQAEGKIVLSGSSILDASEQTLQSLRGSRMAMILQQSMTAFDPLYTLGEQLSEIFAEKLSLSRDQARDKARQAFALVHLPRGTEQKYAHELSGGMLQRCMIAVALTLEAGLIIADEPTTALDAKNQYEVLQRLQGLCGERGVAMIFVSHDLGAVQMVANKILVLCKGESVEQGDSASVFSNPHDPYTRYLVQTRMQVSQCFLRSLGGKSGLH